MRFDLRLEDTSEIKSTTDSLESREAADLGELGVVGKLEATTDSGQLRHRDVSQTIVADKGEGATDVGQVWCREAFEAVGVESERAVDGGERWDRHLGAVSEGHVEGPLQVGKLGVEVSVGAEFQRLGDVAELHVDRLEEWVVGHVEAVNNLEVDTVER